MPSRRPSPRVARSVVMAALRRWRLVRANRRQRARPPLDLHERVLPRAALGQLRGAAVEREDVRVAVDAHRVGIGRVERIVPGAGRELDDARAYRVGHDGAGQTAAAVVERADDVAARDPAGGGVLGMDADRLAAADLAGLT